ncbi:MAG: hypothetical protein KJS95_09405 [Gammaproteobacteria bacterium]|nr:hypothetical protein [Gammaproteobacteria bacterium]
MANRWPHISALIDRGGQVMLGTVKPISNAAVAHDGKKTLAMLKKKPREDLQDLLERLDAAIAEARASGQRVDEINKPGANTRYDM